MHNEAGHKEVKRALKAVDKKAHKEHQKALATRKLKKYNSLITLRVVHHFVDEKGREVERSHLVESMDSVYYSELQRVIHKRIGAADGSHIKLLWLEPGGETVHINSQVMLHQFADKEWCAMPWVLHAIEEPKMRRSAMKFDLCTERYKRRARSPAPRETSPH